MPSNASGGQVCLVCCSFRVFVPPVCFFFLCESRSSLLHVQIQKETDVTLHSSNNRKKSNLIFAASIHQRYYNSMSCAKLDNCTIIKSIDKKIIVASLPIRSLHTIHAFKRVDAQLTEERTQDSIDEVFLRNTFHQI